MQKLDVFELSKKLYDDWEKNLTRYLETTMRQPEFMKLVGQNLESSLDVQAAVKKQVQGMLRGLSIPTEVELSGLYRTVNDLETRMLDLEEKLDLLVPAAPTRTPRPAPRPTRRRATPSRKPKPAPAKAVRKR